MADMTREEMEKAQKRVKDKMRTIDFQVDTVTVDKAAGAAAYFSDGDFTIGPNTITSNYVVDEDENSHQYNQSRETLTHEQKHRDNYLQGMYAYPVSLEQAYKINMHDEISAMMTEIISLREEYIRTGDIHVFDKLPKAEFYKKAVKNGEIKPNSPYQEDFDKEMHLIVNGSQKVWMDTWGYDFYISENSSFAVSTADIDGKYAAYWDKNYQNAMKIAYNIGGVDFTKYMDKDVEIPQNGYAEMLEDMHNYRKDFSLIPAQVFEKSGFPPYDGGMSLNEYKKLLQHQMAINNFATGHQMFNDVTSETKTYSKEEYLKSLNSKETIDKYKEMYEEMLSPKVSNADEMKEKFPTFKSFLKYEQSFDINDYREKFNEATRNEAFIDKIVEYQAAEYAKTGKDFPQNNQQNYQKALNKIYCGAYDMLQPDESNLKSNLSANAKQIADDSNKGWFDKLRDKAQSLKHRLTYIKDEKNEFNDEKYVGLWGKIRHKASQIKEDLTTEIVHNKDGSVTVCERGVMEGVRDKISKWLKPEKTEVKNKPTHPVNKRAPEYPKWSKNKRVSAVQHRKILDMRKPIIKQPTRSKVEQPTKITSSKDKATFRNNMKQDVAKAKNVAQNIGKQKTTTKKIAKVGYKTPSQKQVFKDLYDKVFGR